MKGKNIMQKKKFIDVYRCTGFRQYRNDYVCTIEDTPENIAAFIVSVSSFENFAFMTKYGEERLFSMGNYLDIVHDQEECRILQNAIVPMQMGQREIPDVIYHDRMLYDVKILTAAKSNWETKQGQELDILIDVNERLYFGLEDHYDNHGHYDNYDCSLVLLDNQSDMFHLFCGEGFVLSKKELIECSAFKKETFQKFDLLMASKLKEFHCVQEQMFQGIPYSCDATKYKVLDINKVNLASFSNSTVQTLLHEFTDLEGHYLEGTTIINIFEQNNQYDDVEELPFSRNGYDRYISDDGMYIFKNVDTGDCYSVNKAHNSKNEQALLQLDNLINQMNDLIIPKTENLELEETMESIEEEEMEM